MLANKDRVRVGHVRVTIALALRAGLRPLKTPPLSAAVAVDCSLQRLRLGYYKRTPPDLVNITAIIVVLVAKQWRACSCDTTSEHRQTSSQSYRRLRSQAIEGLHLGYYKRTASTPVNIIAIIVFVAKQRRPRNVVLYMQAILASALTIYFVNKSHAHVGV